MQYWQLVGGLPGLLPLSRFQIGMGIFMYLAALAWTVMIILSALKVFDPEIGAERDHARHRPVRRLLPDHHCPKLVGMLDVRLHPGRDVALWRPVCASWRAA